MLFEIMLLEIKLCQLMADMITVQKRTVSDFFHIKMIERQIMAQNLCKFEGLNVIYKVHMSNNNKGLEEWQLTFNFSSTCLYFIGQY